MKLIPTLMERRPRPVIGALSLLLGSLLGLDHPPGGAWHFVQGFFLGLGATLLLLSFVRARKT